jgi:hypothetical protein
LGFQRGGSNHLLCSRESLLPNTIILAVSGHNIEATSFPFTINNCVNLGPVAATPTSPAILARPEGRQPISAMRFLWDIYDSRNDADGDDYSAVNGHFWQHLSVASFYAEGTELNQHNEPWNPALTQVTEPDGRGSTSYRNNYPLAVPGVSVGLLYLDNCNPI